MWLQPAQLLCFAQQKGQRAGRGSEEVFPSFQPHLCVGLSTSSKQGLVSPWLGKPREAGRAGSQRREFHPCSASSPRGVGGQQIQLKYLFILLYLHICLFVLTEVDLSQVCQFLVAGLVPVWFWIRVFN